MLPLVQYLRLSKPKAPQHPQLPSPLLVQEKVTMGGKHPPSKLLVQNTNGPRSDDQVGPIVELPLGPQQQSTLAGSDANP